MLFAFFRRYRQFLLVSNGTLAYNPPAMPKMKILYAGDSAAGGPANYLLGILRHLGADTLHLPPDKPLAAGRLKKKKFDLFILSDYSKKMLPAAAERELVGQVEAGAGLLMVGGWGSFSGPFGGWRGSRVEKILPVECARRDDRIPFPGGALVVLKNPHPAVAGIAFDPPPVIVGMNDVRPKKNAQVVLAAKKILAVGNHLFFDSIEHPLLVFDSDPRRKVAAFAADFAPHWCGGLVDWGLKPLKLRVRDKIQIEVGETYVQFVSSLIRWLAGA